MLKINKQFPKHVAFIVDGNRRWAKKKGLSPIAGHRRVAFEILEPLVLYCMKVNIPYITFWVFSTENWERGRIFYNALFNILKEGLERNLEKYVLMGIKLKIIGDLSKLSKDLRTRIEKWVEKSKNNKKMTVIVAFNYGGREEIIRAIKRADGLRLTAKKLTTKNFGQFLDTAGIPDPDLIIRTGGEKRLSGFLLWQCQYSELYFTDTLMPDFSVEEFKKALEEYGQRQRRFGR